MPTIQNIHHFSNQEEFDKWEEEICEKHSEHADTNIYCRIDKISCVLVLRNKNG